jgi:methionyl-tRNA formyltransferase
VYLPAACKNGGGGTRHPGLSALTLRDGAAAEQLRALEPELLVVVAYGKILTEEFLRIPKRGAVNLHASLLPKYRGCAPSNGRC